MPNRIFLWPPLDSAGRFAPPNVNEALDACELELDDSLAAASAGSSNTSASALFAEGSTTDGCSNSRAGAGALAAPLPNAGAGAADADGLNPDVMSIEAAWLSSTGRGAGIGTAAASSMTLISGDASFGAAAGVELATATFAAGTGFSSTDRRRPRGAR